MKKDKTTSIRINSQVYEKLKKQGMTPQQIFDDALKRLIKSETKIEIKNEKK